MQEPHEVKAALPDADVAGECVDRIARGVERSWPEIVTLVGPLAGEAADCLDAPDAWLDFGLAAVAVRIQAPGGIVVSRNGTRVRTLILSRVCTSFGATRRHAVERYERAWLDSLTVGGAPLDGVACLLCDRWGISCAGPRGRSPQQDPLIVMVLGTVLLTWATA